MQAAHRRHDIRTACRKNVCHSGYRCGLPQACSLVEGIPAVEYLLADKGCDTEILAGSPGNDDIRPGIPSRKILKNPRGYDWCPSPLRHPARADFLELARWRGMTIGYAKNPALFLGAVLIRSIAIWAKIK